MVKPVRLRLVAEQDIESAFHFYLAEASADIAVEFVAAIDSHIEQLGEFPKIGSTRFAKRLDVPGLRDVVLQRFPYTLFYFERSDHIDVVRLLHQERDLRIDLLDATN